MNAIDESTLENSCRELLLENQRLRERLAESEQVLEAIQRGEVDALAISGPDGERVYTLEGADQSYRVLIETMNEGAITVSSDETILYANKCLEEMLGIPLERFTGRGVRELIAPEDRPAFENLFRQGLNGAAKGEAHLLQGDGKRCPVNLSLKSLIDVGTQAVCIVATNLTERVKKEEELKSYKDHLEQLVERRTAELNKAKREAEQRAAEAEEGKNILEALMEYVPEGITIVEAADMKIRRVSRHGREMLGSIHDGWSVAKVAGQWQIFEADGRTSMKYEDLPICRAMLAGEIVRNAELVQVNARGERLPLLCNAAPIRDADGRIKGGVVAWRDITEIQQMQIALRESEQRYRSLFEEMNEAFALKEILLDDDGRPCDYRFLEVNPAFERHTGLKAENLIGKTLLQVLPQAESIWIERFGKVALTGEPAHFELWSRDLERYYEVSAFQTKPGFFATVLLDISERRQAEQALLASEARFRLLSETAGGLLASPAPEEIVNRLCCRVMEHLNCHVFFNYLMDRRSGRLHLNAYAGIPAEEAQRHEWLGPDESVCGCVARDAEPRVVEDISNRPGGLGGPVECFGIRAYACYPLMAGGPLIGTLSFGAKDRAHFSEADLALMKTVADQVSAALDRVRLIGELERSMDELEVRVRQRTAQLSAANAELRGVPSRLITAQEEERKRLAGELHDSIGQTLAAVKFGIETVLSSMKRGNIEESRQHLDRFVANLQRAIDETRTIYTGLRPRILEEMGLLATIQWFCREFRTLYPKHHIELELEIAEEAIPEALKISIFRICQEALNNIVKHSKAEWVDLSLADSDAGIELVVADDGVGVDLRSIYNNVYANSLGLTGMKERAELTGGSFAIESTPGEGTTVRVLWPKRPVLS